MHKRFVIIALIAGTMTLGWAVRVHTPPLSPPEVSERPTPISRDAATPGLPATSQDSPSPAQPEHTRLDADKAVDVAERAQLQADAREFFARAPALAPEQRDARARDLERELARIERAGGLSAGETFLLRVGLIRETVADPAQQAARIDALRQQYEADARQRTEAAAAITDFGFELYKAHEAEIVAQVSTMQTIPDGLTRDEYLRRRLQSAREKYMGGAR